MNSFQTVITLGGGLETYRLKLCCNLFSLAPFQPKLRITPEIKENTAQSASTNLYMRLLSKGRKKGVTIYRLDLPASIVYVNTSKYMHLI